jgi:FkbM family methyltransferase
MNKYESYIDRMKNKNKSSNISYHLFFNYEDEKNESKELLENQQKIKNNEKTFQKLESLYNHIDFESQYLSHDSHLQNNQNDFSTKNINLRKIAFFESGYKPEWEDIQFESGGYYSFELSFVTDIKLYPLFLFLFQLLKKYTDIKGFYVKYKIRRGTHQFYFQIWSILNHKNDKIIQQLQQFFKENYGIHFLKIEYQLFYPEPIPSSNVISFNEIQHKKVYYLRFDVGIGQFLKKGIWWEEFMNSYFKKYYRANTNVIDVGANFGTHSILLANLISKDCQVFSFEPIYWDIVMMNADVNRIQDKVCVFNKGLGKKNEVIKIKTYDRSMKKPYGRVSLDGLSGLQEDKDLKIEQEVGIITLDSLHLNNISLIKIDVEGMELDVLEGAKDTITRNKPVIFIEFLKSKYNQDMQSPIMKYLLGKCNYHLIPIQESYAGDDYILVPKN